ncbi:MAG TPA: hypothetical protein VNY05_23975 [Candidatus Acidoferrales bacterium]|nr:hypothetical protein [Candidatus Acidoferrales bacterium]
MSTTIRSLPGSITGVAQLQLPLPPGSGPLVPLTVTPTIVGKTLRERLILIWARSK